MRFFFLCGLIFLASCKKESIHSYEEQLKKDQQVIESYLVANQLSPQKDPSGFYYSLIQGDALKPSLEDSVKILTSIHYFNGENVFQTKSQLFLLNKLIDPIRKILPLIGENGSTTLYIPSGLAYGAYPTAKIAANSNLIMEIQLQKIIPEYTKQLKLDIFSIDLALKTLNVTANKDASGLRYVVTQEGDKNALSPIATDLVTISYVAKELQSGIQYDQSNTPVSFYLNKASTLKVWQKGLPLLRVGSKATFYVPSGLAFGSYEKMGVKPNTNVVYEVELLKVSSQ